MRKKKNMKTVIDAFEEYPVKSILVLFISLAIVPPLIIHCIYKVPIVIPFFQAVIPAGDMVSYLGTVLTFCATFLLSMIVFIQNRKSELESRIRTNKTYISEANDKNIIIMLSKEKREDDFVRLDFYLKIKVLSEALISDMFLESYSLADESVWWESLSCNWKIRRYERYIDFHYKDKNEVEIKAMLAKLEEKKVTFFLNKRNISMYLRIGFVSENIRTYIGIKVVLTKTIDYKTSGKYVYKIDNTFIHHESAELVS